MQYLKSCLITAKNGHNSKIKQVVNPIYSK